MVHTKYPIFFDPNYKLPLAPGCGSLDDSIQLEPRYSTIRDYYYNNYFGKEQMKVNPICPTLVLNPSRAAWNDVYDKVITPTPTVGTTTTTTYSPN